MTPLRSRLAALAAALAVALPGAACRLPPPAPAPALDARRVASARAEVNRVFEIRVAAPAGRRAADVALRAEVVAPSGRRTRVPGFALDDAGALAVRIRPREPGVHRWIASVDAGGGWREVASGRLVAEDRGAPGQVVARGGALALEDGRPFHPLGENRFNVYDPTWSDGLAPEAYVARMAAAGMNTLRVFVFSACGAAGAPPQPGCLEPALGRFDPVAARRYDEILEAAERHGVEVVLSIFAVGFTPGDAWKGWEQNPYAAARGGPARTPQDFFTDAAARAAALRRLRYVLARWGASPALLAVDLLNEPEWDGAIDERRWIPWAEELAHTWKAEDPYGHLVTAGPVGLHWNVVTDERAWWASPACDVVQWHRYGPDVYEVHALARELVATIRDTRRYGKPVLVGEFGWGGEAKPAYDHTHVGIWAATFAGAGVLAHSAPPFNEDSDEPMTPARAAHLRVLAGFLARAERGGALAPALPDPVASVPGMRALALARPGLVALWLHAPAAGYGGRVQGATVTVTDLAPGRWRVRWVDDVTGAPAGSAEVTADGGPVVLRVPGFVRHLAATVERERG
jgi:cellulase (glycosyl hydrolase family 5)